MRDFSTLRLWCMFSIAFDRKHLFCCFCFPKWRINHNEFIPRSLFRVRRTTKFSVCGNHLRTGVRTGNIRISSPRFLISRRCCLAQWLDGYEYTVLGWTQYCRVDSFLVEMILNVFRVFDKNTTKSESNVVAVAPLEFNLNLQIHLVVFIFRVCFSFFYFRK